MTPRNRPTLAAAGAMIWLVVAIAPIYLMVVTSLRRQDAYQSASALNPAAGATFDNYARVWHKGFVQFTMNSATVVLATVVLVVLTALPAAYGLVRNDTRALRLVFPLFLFGLAIPAQAVIVPIYLIITRMRLYDSLAAIILPTAAFSVPMSIVVLTSTLRNVPKELYEAMAVDGASPARVFARLVVPLGRSGIVTVVIFSGLNAWNGFLFPLVLTQSPGTRVLPLGLWNFQNQYGTDVPGLMAAAVFSALPVLVLYLFGRRHLLRGLTAGFGQ